MTVFTRANRKAGHSDAGVSPVFGRKPGRPPEFRGERAPEALFTYGLTGDRLFDAITISSAGTLVAGTESRGRQRDRHVTEAHYLGLHRSQFFHRDTENISGIVVYGESRVTASQTSTAMPSSVSPSATMHTGSPMRGSRSMGV